MLDDRDVRDFNSRRSENSLDFQERLVHPKEERFSLTVTPKFHETDEFLWTPKSINLLLEEYLNRLSLFKDPDTKRQVLWGEIQEIFQKQGYDITTDLLDRKFRSMKNTYLEVC